jgi:hypothetical protein
MTTTGRVTDPDIRSALDDAENALDDGEYASSIRKSADVFMELTRRRPDLIVRPMVFGPPRVGGGPPQLPPRAPWPNEYGVVFRYDEDGPLEMVFEKDSFMMSEAITIFEYVLDTAIRAERPPDNTPLAS